MFAQSVVEKIGSYVYCLRDPRNNEIFYIGKGKGNRVFDHIKCSLNYFNESDKLDRIREINNVSKVEHLILKHNIDENHAIFAESCLIDFAIFASNSKINLTNIQRGHDSLENGISTVHEIINKYESDPLNSNEKLLLIKINKLYKNIMNDDEVYNIVRHSWKLNVSRAKKADYILAVANGIVRGVYRNAEFYSVEKNKIIEETVPQQDKGRVYFSADLVGDSEYIGKSTSAFGGRGQANPIRYHNI